MLRNPQRGTRHECRPRLDVEQLRSPTGDRVRTAHRGQNHRYTSRKRRITDLFKVRGDTIRHRIPPFPSHQPARIPDRNSIAHATRFSSTAFYPPGGQPGVFSTGLPARQIKRFTFGDSVRSRSDVAMTNEVLGKVLAHNVCVVIASQCELGIEPVFWPAEKESAPSILRLPMKGV